MLTVVVVSIPSVPSVFALCFGAVADGMFRTGRSSLAHDKMSLSTFLA